MLQCMLYMQQIIKECQLRKTSAIISMITYYYYDVMHVEERNVIWIYLCTMYIQIHFFFLLVTQYHLHAFKGTHYISIYRYSTYNIHSIHNKMWLQYIIQLASSGHPAEHSSIAPHTKYIYIFIRHLHLQWHNFTYTQYATMLYLYTST